MPKNLNKKMIFLTYGVDLSDKSSGIAKKIYSQVEAFKKFGFDVALCGMEKDIYKIGNNFICLSGNYYEDISIIIKNIILYLNENKIELLYIRKIVFSPNIYLKFKIIRKHVDKIILEVPTFPYIGETKKKINKVIYMIEYIMLFLFYRKIIDIVVTFSNDEKIYGIKTCKISNGIDQSIITTNSIKKTNLPPLNIISVSSIDFWHGVDRVLYSISKYRGEIPIIVHIVGGNENKINELKILSDELKISNNVIFYGKLHGKELDKIYNISHIGLGSLGRHRSKVYNLNSLKNREYIAKGLPIIYSEIDSDLDNERFVFKVEANESLIDFNEVIAWYKSLNKDNLSIVNYSKKFLWENQIKKIMELI